MLGIKGARAAITMLTRVGTTRNAVGHCTDCKSMVSKLPSGTATGQGAPEAAGGCTQQPKDGIVSKLEFRCDPGGFDYIRYTFTDGGKGCVSIGRMGEDVTFAVNNAKLHRAPLDHISSASTAHGNTYPTVKGQLGLGFRTEGESATAKGFVLAPRDMAKRIDDADSVSLFTRIAGKASPFMCVGPVTVAAVKNGSVTAEYDIICTQLDDTSATPGVTKSGVVMGG